jgi:hypothetical protein
MNYHCSNYNRTDDRITEIRKQYNKERKQRLEIFLEEAIQKNDLDAIKEYKFQLEILKWKIKINLNDTSSLGLALQTGMSMDV